tara:strand:+ start:5629 stop:5868 length:240 start_codon:yes stop_codon:yes gene_type:complete
MPRDSYGGESVVWAGLGCGAVWRCWAVGGGVGEVCLDAAAGWSGCVHGGMEWWMRGGGGLVVKTVVLDIWWSVDKVGVY